MGGGCGLVPSLTQWLSGPIPTKEAGARSPARLLGGRPTHRCEN